MALVNLHINTTKTIELESVPTNSFFSLKTDDETLNKHVFAKVKSCLDGSCAFVDMDGFYYIDKQLDDFICNNMDLDKCISIYNLPFKADPNSAYQTGRPRLYYDLTSDNPEYDYNKIDREELADYIVYNIIPHLPVQLYEADLTITPI